MLHKSAMPLHNHRVIMMILSAWTQLIIRTERPSFSFLQSRLIWKPLEYSLMPFWSIFSSDQDMHSWWFKTSNWWCIRLSKWNLVEMCLRLQMQLQWTLHYISILLVNHTHHWHGNSTCYITKNPIQHLFGGTNALLAVMRACHRQHALQWTSLLHHYLDKHAHCWIGCYIAN